MRSFLLALFFLCGSVIYLQAQDTKTSVPYKPRRSRCDTTQKFTADQIKMIEVDSRMYTRKKNGRIKIKGSRLTVWMYAESLNQGYTIQTLHHLRKNGKKWKQAGTWKTQKNKGYKFQYGYYDKTNLIKSLSCPDTLAMTTIPGQPELLDLYDRTSSTMGKKALRKITVEEMMALMGSLRSRDTFRKYLKTGDKAFNQDSSQVTLFYITLVRQQDTLRYVARDPFLYTWYTNIQADSALPHTQALSTFPRSIEEAYLKGIPHDPLLWTAYAYEIPGRLLYQLPANFQLRNALQNRRLRDVYVDWVLYRLGYL